MLDAGRVIRLQVGVRDEGGLTKACGLGGGGIPARQGRTGVRSAQGVARWSDVFGTLSKTELRSSDNLRLSVKREATSKAGLVATLD